MKITKNNARDMQLRSAAKRKENNERKAIIRDWLYSELSKPASSGGGGDTLGLYFVKKALQGIVATVTLEDIERMQRILGESSLNIKLEETDPAANLSSLIKKSRANS